MAASSSSEDELAMAIVSANEHFEIVLYNLLYCNKFIMSQFMGLYWYCCHVYLMI